MSTLADLVVPTHEVMAAVWRRLNGDATLQTELGGAGRVVNGPKAPDGVGSRRLHVQHVVHTVDMDTYHTRFVLQLRAVAANPGAGVAADTETLGKISTRAGQLVEGNGIFSGSGLRFFDSWVEGGEGPLFDPRDPEHHHQVTRFVVRARKTP